MEKGHLIQIGKGKVRSFLEVTVGSFKGPVVDDLGKERKACLEKETSYVQWHEKKMKHSEKCNWLICLVLIICGWKKKKEEIGNKGSNL